MIHLNCATHGRQKQTFVCKHITATLKDGEARGFVWSYEGEGKDAMFEALCMECNDLDEAAFAATANDIIMALCYGCFREAAAINGMILD